PQSSIKLRLPRGTPMRTVANRHGPARQAQSLPIRTMSFRSTGLRRARRSLLHSDRSKPAILLINCSSRSEHTFPGEMSKSYRLAQIAREVFGITRPQPPCFRIRTPHLPVQGLLLHGAGALSLALFLLYQRLSSTDTSAIGSRTRPAAPISMLTRRF